MHPAAGAVAVGARISQWSGRSHRQVAGGTATGYTLGGTGWYRKHFTLGKETLGKRISIQFDGVYMNSDVWLNGHPLGNHPYGYTAFAYDLTEFLNPPGQENVLAVRVNNAGRNSRWYSGSGIYRHVVLEVTDPLHVGQWGVSVTTPQVTKQKATVSVVTTMENGQKEGTAVTLRIKLLGPTGKTLQTGETNIQMAAGGHVEIPTGLRRQVAAALVTRCSASLPCRSGAFGRRQSGGHEHDNLRHSRD